ncbi:hypothetical protein P152DRAFT_41931 [Eremomyces bilateralis CBS 781.70]|uniref:Uncharacterized protein n=1 Tax=Eremomyces bilateralis CBS 781.70 TaxID=1392243 RepID=A0A6G1G1Y9_9PEZI|nr:uncharacterized protein P152DRAFT_41931 [Eremomyces bilateralis CBS 781.70]KAF1812002.1 hypothetical protein P152DRAFT_41931 [Eremomyces bilateralis CBS 781.70]
MDAVSRSATSGSFVLVRSFTQPGISMFIVVGMPTFVVVLRTACFREQYNAGYVNIPPTIVERFADENPISYRPHLTLFVRSSQYSAGWSHFSLVSRLSPHLCWVAHLMLVSRLSHNFFGRRSYYALISSVCSMFLLCTHLIDLATRFHFTPLSQQAMSGSDT